MARTHASVNKKFTLQLDNFIKKVELAPQVVTKRVALELFRRIVFKTPVDTGRARGSWTISVNEADRTVLPPAPPGQQYPPPQLTPIGVLDVRSNESIIISNNLPYIRELEYGHSKQAPHGMVRLSIAEVKLMMRKFINQGLKDVGL